MTAFVDHLDALTNAQNVEDLWALHTEKMATYGFDRLIYGFSRYVTSNSLGDPRDWVIMTNHGDDYMNVFIDQGLYWHAPMLRWALENDGACSWRWMATPGNLTADEERVAQFNIKMGVTAGYTMSFRSVSQRAKAAMAITAKEGMTQDAVEQVWVRHGTEIAVICNVFHLKLLTLPHASRKLTSRQREVLQWVGDGKTTQDIAVLLELTPATVEKHLRLAREALDVETTAQAVLKAAFYNQMFIIDID